MGGGAAEGEDTNLLSAEIAECPESASASAPDEETLTRSVIPVNRSCTNTSACWFVCERTRSSARL
jgi:hypothetical protein